MPKALSPKQIEQYHRDGYLSPFTLFSADGLPRLREVIANRIDELS